MTALWFKKILISLAVVGTVFLGGFSYAQVFWHHPFFSGFPDIAVFAQSSAQTIERATITAERNTGERPLLIQLFPFAFVQTSVATFVNGLGPLTNLWILQEILPFIFAGLFIIIGRNLTKSIFGGILTSLLVTLISDRPLFIDEAFSQFISSYYLSSVVFVGAIAFVPYLIKKRAAIAIPSITILMSGMLLYHHHFGPLRLLAFGISLIILGGVSWKKISDTVVKKNIIGCLLAAVGLVGFLILSDLPYFITFVREGIPLILATPAAPSSPQAPIVILAQSSSWFDKAKNIIPPLTLIIHEPLLVFIFALAAGGFIVSWAVPAIRRESRSHTKLLLTGLLLTQLPFYNMAFSLPPRYLREITLTMIPFGAFMLYRMVRFQKNVFIIAPSIALLLIAATPSWVNRMHGLEKTMNTNWEEIRAINWLHQHAKSNASVLTDPFTFHILLASIPYIKNPIIGIKPFGLQSDETIERAAYDIMTLDAKTLVKSLGQLCPEFVVIDPPQTFQFFPNAPSNEYYTHPQLLEVVYDSHTHPNTRIVIFKSHALCSKK